MIYLEKSAGAVTEPLVWCMDQSISTCPLAEWNIVDCHCYKGKRVLGYRQLLTWVITMSWPGLLNIIFSKANNCKFVT